MIDVIWNALPSVWKQVPTVAQVFFWGTGGVLAILTYRRARKSILQPAKTEVFKLQVGKLQSLLDPLDWNGPVDAWERSGLAESFEINGHELIDRYATSKGLRRSGGVGKARVKPASSLINVEAAEDQFVLIEPGEKRQEKPDTDVVEWNDAVKNDIRWAEYKHWAVHIGPKLFAVLEAITKFAADPVVPTFVAEELELLHSDLTEAVERMGPTIEKCAALMAEHYPAAKDVISAKWDWLPNQLPSDEKYAFYGRVERLRASIRTYLKSDQMFDM
ncbi:MAG: hypothetical protein GXY44_11585 [Phycisphaerales bacterium]|nr:hypothetical protein [Phycisphaerales bacterium]